MATTSSWLVIEELYARGDPGFVDALRACDDAPRLAAFAATWFADRRSSARSSLLEYLRRPLNAYHHEGLVKRLYKLAEKAGDDEALAHFLVLFDRSIRRRTKSTFHFENRTVNDKREAEALRRQWEAAGAQTTNISGGRGSFYVYAHWPIEKIVVPRGSTMPRGVVVQSSFWGKVTDLEIKLRLRGRPPKTLSEEIRKKLERFRLFTVHTRNYMRRRTWRYFRNLGKTAPERYIPAVLTALKLYQDDDVEDGLALLDNWGLVHILFRHSPALWPRSHGWTLQPGHTLGELKPSPAFAELWQRAPHAFLELLKNAQCRPVRQWVVHFLRVEPSILARASLEDLLGLLTSDLAEVGALAGEYLNEHAGTATVPPDRWLKLLETATPAALDVICSLVSKFVRPEQASLEQVVSLACSRPVPVARLGFRWLQQRQPADLWDGSAIRPTLWRVLEAQSDTQRPEIVRWLRSVLAQSEAFEPDWVLEFLDSRHADVRTEGWDWLMQSAPSPPAPLPPGRGEHPRDAVQIWQRLFESPYDDVRLRLVAHLEERFGKKTVALPKNVALAPDLVRLLWATVLLNIHRGNRHKPMVVRQMARRLADCPDDAPLLLPLFKVALRSLRGPEWRAGLAGIVQLVQRRPDLASLVEKEISELQLQGVQG